MNRSRPASLHLTDEEFAAAVEGCTLSPDFFAHADHVRLAWMFIREQPIELASLRMAMAIRCYATSLGAAEKYHETITRAWMQLVADAVENAPPNESFEDFMARCPDLFDKGRLNAHYSAELLASDAARSAWIEPDLLGLGTDGAKSSKQEGTSGP
jgi:hypothetical protein